MSNSQRILEILKVDGASTSADIAKKLDITPMGARQHLLQLHKKELVSHFQKAEKVGRPSQYWQLTKSAHDSFGDGHNHLASNLIQQISVVFGDEGLNKILDAREQAIEIEYLEALNKCERISDKLDELVRLRNKEGYMATWHAEGEHFWFVENHCPICEAAKSCQQLCASERNLFGKCFKNVAMVEREEHILKGQRRCTYKLTPKTI